MALNPRRLFLKLLSNLPLDNSSPLIYASIEAMKY